MHERSYLIRAASFDADAADNESRSIPAILATEFQATVFDVRRRAPIDEILLMSGFVPQPAEEVCLVDTHPQARTEHGTITTEDVRGSVRDIGVQGDRLLGALCFADDQPSSDLWQKVLDRHVRFLSVGTNALEQVRIEPGRTATIGGREFKAGPRVLFVTTRWLLLEVSLVARAADENAKILRAPFGGDLPGESEPMLIRPAASEGMTLHGGCCA